MEKLYQEGFGGNPVHKESWWRLTRDMAIKAARYGIFNDVENMAIANGLHNFCLDLVNGTKLYKGVETATKNKKELKKNPQEIEMAKTLIKNKHTFYFAVRNPETGVKSYDGILDGKLADLKDMQGLKVDSIYSNMKDTDEKKASVAVLRMPQNATYSEYDAINYIRDIFSGTHTTTKGVVLHAKFDFLNEVLLIDKLNNIWTIKK